MNNNDNVSYYEGSGQQNVVSEVGLAKFFAKMYRYMSMALLVSAITAWSTANVFTGLMQAISTNRLFFYGLIIVEFALVLAVNSKGIRGVASALPMLILFSIVNGVLLSSIFVIYSGASIIGAFVGTAAIFISMSVWGMVTKKSMTKLGSHLFGALIGLIVASVVNMFLGNGAVGLFLSWASVIIFTLLSAYDTNKMKQIYMQNGNSANMTGLAVFGALSLYLDFINIFLSLLRIFGGGRD
ncbi:Bax inhibitor-1/YccA family protein [Periweissella cryptocerci]|uniref:Bax inhibitor-1/YccA family protein n=1 Tax=Periweissella cryptocerci TaxID=2506420 RepID=A0A4P6YS36_9LACO|nr:Bax inhibitor-1/YccA family protein [Periweissella cryptocerci]QBO35461.1 Bax inhibitor-1/YccA family protein [Periweissella cryptocerci]